MITDFIKNAFINLKRNKKNKILIAISVLLFILLFVDVIIIKNFYDFYDYSINNNLGFRTFSVYHPTKEKDEAIYELRQIDHVVEVLEARYRDTVVDSDLNDNGMDGVIRLLYGTENITPHSVKGKDISELKTGEIICPVKFYPDTSHANALKIEEENFLYEDKTLNREITANYFSNKSVVENNRIINKREEYSKKLKIVGLYDEEQNKNGLSTCYATLTDIKEIADSYNPPMEKINYSSLHVIVDKEENVVNIRQKIQDIGGYQIDTQSLSSLDKNYVGILFSITIILALVITISFISITKNYLSKKIQTESKYIGILRSCGYTKKHVILQELVENIIVTSTSFLISFVIYIGLFTILNEKIMKNFKYIGFSISNHVLILIIIFIVVLIITELINYSLINKKINNLISDILKEN